MVHACNAVVDSRPGIVLVVSLALAMVLPALIVATPCDAAEDEETFEAVIAEIVAVGRHPDMKWPDFSDVRADIKRFYEEHQEMSGWFTERPVADGTRQMATMLAGARSRGLDPTDFEGHKWEGIIARYDAGELTVREHALAEIAMNVCAARYVSAINHGRVNPRRVSFEFDVDEKRHRLWEFLRTVSRDEGLDEIVTQLAPPLPAYRHLMAQLARYQRFADEFDWRPVADARVIRPGDSCTDANYLARLLATLGDLPEAEAGTGREYYEGALVAAMKNFQKRHGLQADGIMGRRTYAALNTPPAVLVEKIELTLERLRWFDGVDEESVIVANVPGFVLICIEGQGEDRTSALTMDVIVGKEFPEKQTPIFAEQMTYLDFSPYWNVPDSIAKRSLIPAIEADPAELEKRDLEIVPHFGNDVKALPPTEANIARVVRGELKLRQRPGPQNALGLVKFIMPNAHSVYLHSTPQQSLFARDRRAYSSGCIRVAQPVDLAEYVLQDQEGWDRARIEEAMTAGRPTRIILDQPRWVLLFYGTALAYLTGEIYFYEDIYGHDEELKRALARGYPYPR